MQNIYSGLAELREINDLPELLRGQMKVYGWRMTFYSDSHLWIRIGSWIVSSNLPILWYADPKLEPHLLQNARKQASLSGKTFCRTTSSSFNVSMPVYTLDLDYVPYQHIQSSIQKTLSSLQPGTSLVVNFTAIQQATAYLDEQFVLCAIPFLPRKYGNSHTKKKHVRTAVPLYLTLPHALEIISNAPNTTIHSVENASRERALSLQAWEQLLVHDRKLRSVYIDENGIESWRENRFLLAWEAGLLMAEFLIRWHVVIQKQ
ncbi:hypothetical protein BDQ12DRAFT_676119 [Crucibulum laeve]|uniref:Uncharacterized protein n=1 Tax=Crucibulum laeve TaxID=68775 RepID=A0A5C3MBV2_9AGAR|nr:hypothetical protein BDQ12DRAFT_676119 [Crucibulum laeve]